ncbi:helix-turn-helix domain-containing protein [Crenothrix polyspora]|uniref:helix-turn-helix domain-containing protein n=1 Tax=Crenothrix polyspora TaxID=360316 RepID=UPI00111E58E4|nr:helix-turn-helix domain-containing protein [Crenothrix polyspora]
MKIHEYINLHTKRAEARREMAKSLNVAESTVRSWANGTRHPKRTLWDVIEKETNGAVKAIDLI